MYKDENKGSVNLPIKVTIHSSHVYYCSLTENDSITFLRQIKV